MRDLGYWMLAMFQNRSGTCYSTVMVGSDRAYRARPVSHRWRAAARGVTFVQHTCSSCAAASRRTAPAVGESFGAPDMMSALAALAHSLRFALMMIHGVMTVTLAIHSPTAKIPRPAREGSIYILALCPLYALIWRPLSLSSILWSSLIVWQNLNVSVLLP